MAEEKGVVRFIFVAGAAVGLAVGLFQLYDYLKPFSRKNGDGKPAASAGVQAAEQSQGIPATDGKRLSDDNVGTTADANAAGAGAQAQNASLPGAEASGAAPENAAAGSNAGAGTTPPHDAGSPTQGGSTPPPSVSGEYLIYPDLVKADYAGAGSAGEAQLAYKISLTRPDRSVETRDMTAGPGNIQAVTFELAGMTFSVRPVIAPPKQESAAGRWSGSGSVLYTINDEVGSLVCELNFDENGLHEMRLGPWSGDYTLSPTDNGFLLANRAGQALLKLEPVSAAHLETATATSADRRTHISYRIASARLKISTY